MVSVNQTSLYKTNFPILFQDWETVFVEIKKYDEYKKKISC